MAGKLTYTTNTDAPARERSLDKRQGRSMSLRSRLIALALSILVPALVGAAYGLHMVRQQHVQDASDALMQLAVALAAAVEKEIAAKEAMLKTMALLPALQQGDLASFYGHARSAAPTFERTFVVSLASGEQILNTRLPLKSLLPKTSVLTDLRRAAGDKVTLVSDLYLAPVGKQYSYAVQVPVRRGDRLLYYLSTGSFASTLQQFIDDQRLRPGWNASIVDRRGMIVARRVKAEEYVGKPATAEFIQQMRSAPQGIFETIRLDGTHVYTAFAPIGSTGWTMAASMPKAEFSALPGSTFQFAVALTIVLFTVGLIGVVLVMRQINSDVAHLMDMARALGRGEPLPQPRSTMHETQYVATELGHASEKLRAASATLEARVREAVAETQRAQEALLEHQQRESEARFSGLLDQAPFSMQILSPDGRTLRVNRAWMELWGLAPEDVADYNILEDQQLEVKGVLAELRRAFAGEAVKLPTIMYDVRETLPQLPPGENYTRWVSAVAFPLKDESGKVGEVVLVHEDVSVRVRAEEALRESEQKLRLLADTIPQLAWMARADGHVFWYNRRWYEYTGATPEQMEGWGWQSVHDPAVLPDVLARWRTSLERGEPFDMVFPLRGADGEFRPFLTRVNPLRDAAGNIEYWFGTNTDISDIKRMEERLREADRRKDEFLATLAHELRNPLAPLRQSLDVLKMSRNPEAILGNVRDIMDRQVSHLVRLVDDLLELSRITRGAFELHKAPVEVNSVIDAALEASKPAIDARHHKLILLRPHNQLVVMGDAVRLAQVLSNLLNNAASYTPAGGVISLEARQDGREVLLEVADNGEGIDSADLPRLFQMFSRGQHTSRTNQRGLGIGLALVRSLVEMHGGSVSAQSDGRGKGSRFIVRLPLVGHEVTREGEDTHALPPLKKRVLVVDDNHDAATTLAWVLRSLGAQVEEAYDGPTALRKFHECRPEVVLLDIGMPGMDGYEVANRLRSAGQPVTLVALTGWGQDEDRRRAQDAGFDEHLTKPADTYDVYRVVSRARHTRIA